jgi:acyl transferase domain-containing protein
MTYHDQSLEAIAETGTTEQFPGAGEMAECQPQLLVISAQSATELDKLALRLADHLESDAPDLAEVAHTLATGHREFPHRRAFTAGNTAEAISKLRAAGTTTFNPAAAPRVAFLFPGQCSRRAAMGREIYESEPAFRAAVDECARLLLPSLRLDVRSTLFSERNALDAGHDHHSTAMSLACNFVLDYAFAKLWMSWGIQPSLLIGHGTGEYVAAVIAGTFKVENALHLLANLAHLVQSLPAGSMLAVNAGADQLSLPGEIDLASIDSPRHCTVSGSIEAIATFQKQLEARKTSCTRIKTSRAFHSALMDPILETFAGDTAMIPTRPHNIPWISTATGAVVDAATVADPNYWSRQLRHTVRFTEALATAFAEKDVVLLEVGTGQDLAQFARLHPNCENASVISTLSTQFAGTTDLLAATGELWKSGIIPDWSTFFKGRQRSHLHLPTIPLERHGYRIDNSHESDSPNGISIRTINRDPLRLNHQPTIHSLASGAAPFVLPPNQEPSCHQEQLRPAYNVTARFQLDGVLDRGLLKSALHALAARHESLRTRFLEEDGKLLRVVEREVNFPLPCRDLTNLSTRALAAEVDRLGLIEAKSHFNLSKAPLVRASLILIGIKLHILQLTFHQAIGEDRSIGDMMAELADIYNASSEYRMPRLEPLTAQDPNCTIS